MLRIVALLLTIAAPMANATDPPSTVAQVDIKGIRIGMTRTEVTRMFPTWEGFTVAGVAQHAAFRDPTVFHKGKLDRFVFAFYPQSFEAVLSAVKEKYPTLACRTVTITDSAGTNAEQTMCAVADPNSVLLIRRFATDLQTSMIALYSRRFLAEDTNRALKQKKDI
jgi:hypothetical protein